MRKVNIENVQEAGEFNRLPAGGYVCRYTAVRDNESREYLEMEFDIAEGQYKGYYKSMYENMNNDNKFWPGRVIRSYKTNALPFFKRMCSAVAKSNPGFVFDGGKQNSDEKTLAGKLVGLVISYEEYDGNDGKVKVRAVHKEYSIFDIRSGNFKVPEFKKLAGSTNAPTATPTPAPGTDGFMNIPDGVDEELPFN